MSDEQAAAAPNEVDTKAAEEAAALKALLDNHADNRAALCAKLDEVKLALVAYGDKLAADPSRIGYADSFVQHGYHLADEWLHWIERN